MATVTLSYNTIIIGGEVSIEDKYASNAVITPGFLLEIQNSGGTPVLAPHSTASVAPGAFVALERQEYNLGIDDNYASGDLVRTGFFHAGSTFYGLIPNATVVTPGTELVSNGAGLFTTTLASGDARFQSLEAKTAVGNTRVLIRVNH